MKCFPAALCAALVLGLAPAARPQGAENPGHEVFEAKCSSCHGLDRALKKTKPREGWVKTVQRMRAYAPDTMSDEEVRLIVDYLSGRGPQR